MLVSPIYLPEWEEMKLTITKQRPEADLPPATQTPFLEFHSLNRLQVFWLDGNMKSPPKHDELVGVDAHGPETPERKVESMLLPEALQVLPENVRTEDFVPLWVCWCWQSALLTLQGCLTATSSECCEDAIDDEDGA